MKVKEIARTANVAWSPAGMQNIFLACGTVAQQLDATFSTSAKLEVFSLDLAESGLSVPLAGAIDCPLRFHKLAWSGYGQEGSNGCGVIAGGSDNGIVTLWSADKIISGAEDPQLHQTVQHTGPVRTIDFNPFQPNLLASGASESEIFIWDLNSPTSPMSPGNKIHPLEDVSGIAWNRQVQHILASTCPSGRSIVWDLRKNEPIIQVADPNSRVHCNAIAWHPDVATQMVTASGDDRSPIVQLWDLRFATSPMRTLERHKKGVLSVAWCTQDSDLLLSAAKDNLVLCWNPNTDVPGGEVVYELPATSQWIFECHWCPRNPAVISTASFDGHVTMYSLLGGGQVHEEVDVVKKPTPSDDPFANLLATRPQQQQPVETTPLKKPPKWFRRPCGARFAFGGKLVSFADDKSSQSRSVHITQVVTEQTLLQRSSTLEEALSHQDFAKFCSEKSADSVNSSEQNIWNFLKVTFEPEPRRQYLNLLGYDPEQLEQKLSRFRSGALATVAGGSLDPSDLSQRLSSLPPEAESEGDSAPLFGGDDTGGGSVFDSLSEEGTAKKAVPPKTFSRLTISTESDVEGALSKALLVGNFEAAVDICIGADRMAEAMILAIAGGSALLQKTQETFFQQNVTQINRLMSSIVNRDWTQLVRVCNLDNWREILAALVTYASPDEFSPLCDLLGERLENEGEGRYRDNANLCYICSGSVDKFVECWSKTTNGSPVSALALQDLVEKVTLLRRAVERERKQFSGPSSAVVAEKFIAYSNLLASQGSLATALSYLEMSGASEKNSILLDRLYQAQGGKPSDLNSKLPFQTVDVQPQRMEPGQEHQSNVPTQPLVQHAAGPHTVPTTSTSTAVTNPYQRPTGGNPSPQPPTFTPYNPGLPSVPVAPPTVPSGVPIAPPTALPPPSRAPGIHTNVFTPAPPMPSWNDPPPIATKKKTPVPIPQPITAPVMAPIVAPVPSATPVDHHQPTSTPASTQPPVQVIEKPPIPPEHQPMVSAFESTLQKCKAAATTTALRRKTEDVSKKLSILCDLLRESRVSPDVLQGLHYISQDASSLNYQVGLGRYTQMVSSGSFSEISSFMPGIKTLLQMAMQLQV